MYKNYLKNTIQWLYWDDEYYNTYSVMLENDVVIDYHLNILSTYVGANQVAYIDKVILTKNDVIYEFKV